MPLTSPETANLILDSQLQIISYRYGRGFNNPFDNSPIGLNYQSTTVYQSGRIKKCITDVLTDTLPRQCTIVCMSGRNLGRYRAIIRPNTAHTTAILLRQINFQRLSPRPHEFIGIVTASGRSIKTIYGVDYVHTTSTATDGRNLINWTVASEQHLKDIATMAQSPTGIVPTALYISNDDGSVKAMTGTVEAFAPGLAIVKAMPIEEREREQKAGHNLT